MSSIIRRVSSSAALLVESHSARFFFVPQNALQALVRLAQGCAESWERFTWVCLSEDFNIENPSTGLASEWFTPIAVSERFLVIDREGLSLKATDSNGNDYQSASLRLNELAAYFLKSVATAS